METIWQITNKWAENKLQLQVTGVTQQSVSPFEWSTRFLYFYSNNRLFYTFMQIFALCWKTMGDLQAHYTRWLEEDWGHLQGIGFPLTEGTCARWWSIGQLLLRPAAESVYTAVGAIKQEFITDTVLHCTVCVTLMTASLCSEKVETLCVFRLTGLILTLDTHVYRCRKIGKTLLHIYLFIYYIFINIWFTVSLIFSQLPVISCSYTNS